jgi:hypothetical protein
MASWSFLWAFALGLVIVHFLWAGLVLYWVFSRLDGL